MPPELSAPPPSAVRRRRTHKLILTGCRSAYEWLILALLLALPLAGPVLYGAVTLWVAGPLLLLTLTGVLLFAVRPIWAPDARRIHVPPGAWAWGLFVLYGVLRIPFSGVPYDARLELILVGGGMAAYWTWTSVAAHYHRWKVLLGILIAVVSLIAWYAIVQHSHGSRMVLFRERPEVYGLRASGTYICPNHFANLLEMILPFCLALACTASAGIFLRMLSAYGLLLFPPTLLLTQSRSGYLAAAAGLGLTALLLALRKSRRIFWCLILLIPVVLISLSALLWNVSPTFRQRVTGASIQSPDPAVEARLFMWQDTWAMIRDRPWFGRGPGNFEWFYPRYQQHRMQYWFDYAHNEVLQLVADYGVVGLALFLLFVGAATFRLLPQVTRCARQKDAHLVAALAGSLAACAVHGLFDFNFHIYANSHVLILLAGVTASGLFANGPLESRPLRGPWSVAGWIAGTLIVLALWFGVAQAFVGDVLNSAALYHRDLVKLDKAAALYERSLRLDPGNGDTYLGLGETLLIQGFWSLDRELRAAKTDQAIRVFQEGRKKNPCLLEIQLGLSRALAKAGDPEQARDLVLGVAEFAHHDLFYLTQAGLQLRRMGFVEDSQRVLEQASRVGMTDTLRLNLQRLKKFRDSLAAPPP